MCSVQAIHTKQCNTPYLLLMELGPIVTWGFKGQGHRGLKPEVFQMQSSIAKVTKHL
jgi:hypothetical protein